MNELNKLKRLGFIFSIFLKIGCLAFGGGYTIIALLQKDVVEDKKWIQTEDLMDMMVMVKSLPGVLYINASTMIGYRLAGFWGACVAVLAGTLPTFIISLLVVMYFWKYMSAVIIIKAVKGILVGVSALISYSILRMWPQSMVSIKDFFLLFVAMTLLMVFKVNPAWVILSIGFTNFMFSMFTIKDLEVSCDV